MGIGACVSIQPRRKINGQARSASRMHHLQPLPDQRAVRAACFVTRAQPQQSVNAQVKARGWLAGNQNASGDRSVVRCLRIGWPDLVFAVRVKAGSGPGHHHDKAVSLPPMVKMQGRFKPITAIVARPAGDPNAACMWTKCHC